LSRAIDLLVARGHLEYDVLWKYTIDQVLLYLRSARRNMALEELSIARAVNRGFGANKEEWEKYVAGLTESKPKEKEFTKKDIADLNRILSGKR
jgi:hypothetical protein